MNDKKIEFGLKFDTSDFDKSIEEMQRKLKDITSPIDLMKAQKESSQKRGPQGLEVSTPTKEAYSKASSQGRRDLDKSIKDEVKANEDLVKTFHARGEEIKKYKDQQSQVVKQLEKEEEALKRIDKVKNPDKAKKAQDAVTKTLQEQINLTAKLHSMQDSQAKSVEMYKQRDAAIDAMQEAKERMKPPAIDRMVEAYKEKGFKGVLSEGAALAKDAGPAALIGGVGSALAGIGAIGLAGSQMYRDYQKAPLETLSAMGSASQNTMGKEAQNTHAKRTVFEMPFLEQKAKAAQMALDFMKADRTADTAGMWSKLLMGSGAVAGGAYMGATHGGAAGAALGSIVPGVGTAIGGAVGTAGGAILGGAAGAYGTYKAMNNNEQDKLLSSLPFVGEQYKKRYEANKISDAAKNMQQAYEDQKNLDPYKKAAVGEYEQNLQSDLQFQREMGLSDVQFEGRAPKKAARPESVEKLSAQFDTALKATGTAKPTERIEKLKNQFDTALSAAETTKPTELNTPKQVPTPVSTQATPIEPKPVPTQATSLIAPEEPKTVEKAELSKQPETAIVRPKPVVPEVTKAPPAPRIVSKPTEVEKRAIEPLEIERVEEPKLEIEKVEQPEKAIKAAPEKKAPATPKIQESVRPTVTPIVPEVTKAPPAPRIVKDYQESAIAPAPDLETPTVPAFSIDQGTSSIDRQEKDINADDRSFKQKAIDSGFLPEQAMEAAKGIQAAGGSTRMSQESAFSLQAQRGTNLTNSNQVLGTLSGGLGGAGTSESAFIKILAAGMGKGLDDSKFAEEQRRFSQITAEIISRTGAKTGEDQSKAAEGFSKYVAENTNRGMDAAKNAYEQYQSMSQETSGPRGVMRAAGFMKDKQLSKLSTVQKQALMGMKEEDINENNLTAVGMAAQIQESMPVDKKTGKQEHFGVAELSERVKKTNEQSVSRYGDHDAARDRLRKSGFDISKVKSEEDFRKLDRQTQKDITTMGGLERMDNNFADSRTAQSFMAGQIGGQTAPKDILADREAVQKRKVEGGAGDTGRVRDELVEAQSKDAQLVLKNMVSMREEMGASAKATSAYTDTIRTLNAVLSAAVADAAKSGKVMTDSKTFEDILKTQAKMGNQTQQQAGKTSN